MTVVERHSTYGRHNLLAEAHRVLHGVRFATPDDRVAVAERVTEFAISKSLRLTPPELCHVPHHFRRADGSSRLRPRTHVVYTTTAILEAETRLLEAARQVSGPRVGEVVVATATSGNLTGRAHELSADQSLAVEKIVTSGRVVDVLVGPAGTGKTTAMAGLRAVWEATHGSGSVIGLAPSAVAAQVLSDELGIETENTAKWLTNWRRVPEMAAIRRRLETNLARHPYPSSPAAARLRAKLRSVEQTIARSRLSPGQLVIVDEASLASTFVLDELVSAARQAGAKLLLVGDWAQLGSIDAGGAFSLLVRDRGDLVPQLSDVRRFVASWERDASLGLRVGDDAVIDAYDSHGRIAGGERTEMIAAIYNAWRADVGAGKSSLMIGADAATATELNRLARADRVATGAVSDDGVRIADGQIAGIGDEVFTRQNDRRLAAGSGWVKNGDRWAVTAAHADGTMAVRSASGGTEVTLPASYVAEHVELAYATTAFRAQGRTVDTAHAMVSPTMTREVLYVSATRGRESNQLYVDVAYDPDPATGHDGAVMPQTAHDVLAAVLANEGRELSAHETLARAQRQSDDLATLAAEYEAIARVAEQERWDALLDRCGLGVRRADEVRQSDAYGPLIAALRRAEAYGLDLESGLRDLVAERGLVGVDDVAAVLHHRVEMWIGAAGAKRPDGADMVAGLVPRAVGVTDPDLARALVEREEAMTRRSREPDAPQLSQGPRPTLHIDPATPADSPAAESAAVPSL
ncbi:MAG: ATP-dependent DNA helicase [Acidimicrobiales bacterium]